MGDDLRQHEDQQYAADPAAAQGRRHGDEARGRVGDAHRSQQTFDRAPPRRLDAFDHAGEHLIVTSSVNVPAKETLARAAPDEVLLH
ncbi:hypothetical protein GCM10022234_23050 [Aeromicrobium panaciterrae]